MERFNNIVDQLVEIDFDLGDVIELSGDADLCNTLRNELNLSPENVGDLSTKFILDIREKGCLQSGTAKEVYLVMNYLTVTAPYLGISESFLSELLTGFIDYLKRQKND